jgi:hypothetical protein
MSEEIDDESSLEPSDHDEVLTPDYVEEGSYSSRIEEHADTVASYIERGNSLVSFDMSPEAQKAGKSFEILQAEIESLHPRYAQRMLQHAQNGSTDEMRNLARAVDQNSEYLDSEYGVDEQLEVAMENLGNALGIEFDDEEVN